MFGENWTNNAGTKILSQADVRQLRNAGFDVLYAPTSKNPYHVRVIAKDKNFNEEGIQLSDEIFRVVGSLKIK